MEAILIYFFAFLVSLLGWTGYLAYRLSRLRGAHHDDRSEVYRAFERVWVRLGRLERKTFPDDHNAYLYTGLSSQAIADGSVTFSGVTEPEPEPTPKPAPKPTRSGRIVLDRDQVRNIKLARKNGVTAFDLAQDYEVSEATIYRALQNPLSYYPIR